MHKTLRSNGPRFREAAHRVERAGVCGGAIDILLRNRETLDR